MADLVDSKWKGKLAICRSKPLQVLHILHFQFFLLLMDNGDGGWGYIRKYVDTLNGNILSSSSAPHKGVSDGEYLYVYYT